MKKALAILFFTVIYSASVLAQKLDASAVPASIKISFIKKFPGITPDWIKKNGQYAAGFTHEGHSILAMFDDNGTMTESEVSIQISELPEAAIEFVKSHRKGASIKKAFKITKANYEINYETETNRMNILFDDKGNFLRAVRKS
jgi:hypothetical protein